MKDVELFCKEKDLEDKVDMVEKGALIAQDPANFESIEASTEVEREALRYEAAHKYVRNGVAAFHSCADVR